MTHAHSQVIKVLNKVLKVVQQSSLFVLIVSVRILHWRRGFYSNICVHTQFEELRNLYTCIHFTVIANRTCVYKRNVSYNGNVGNAVDTVAFHVHDEPNTVAARWTKWLKRFEGAMTGFNISDYKRKKALLLHFAGEDVQDIFETLTDTGDEKDYQKATTALTAYFTPKRNIVYETIHFRRTKQHGEETIDAYMSRVFAHSP